MPTGPTLVILNPVAGRGRGRKAAPAVLRALEALGPVLFHETTSAEDARHAASQCDGSVSRIVVVGGDGTLNEVVNGLAKRDVVLGLVPVGGANVLARELGIPRSINAALDVIRTGVTRRIDTGRVSGRRFLLMVGVGFDAAVVRCVRERRRGRLGFRGYVRPFTDCLVNYAFPRFSVSVDGVLVSADAVQAVVANTRNYAGIAAVASRACVEDGRLEVVVIETASKLALLRQAFRAFRACIRDDRGVRVCSGVSVSIEGGVDVPVQIDGDAADSLPVEIGIEPRALRVIGPRPSDGGVE